MPAALQTPPQQATSPSSSISEEILDSFPGIMARGQYDRPLQDIVNQTIRSKPVYGPPRPPGSTSPRNANVTNPISSQTFRYGTQTSTSNTGRELSDKRN